MKQTIIDKDRQIVDYARQKHISYWDAMLMLYKNPISDPKYQGDSFSLLNIWRERCVRLLDDYKNEVRYEKTHPIAGENWAEDYKRMLQDWEDVDKNSITELEKFRDKYDY